MAKKAISISAKIWLSLSILVVGYLISTVVGLIMGMKNQERLQYVSERLFPAAKQSQLAVVSFREQIRLYSVAILMGEANALEAAGEKATDVEKALKAIIALNYNQLTEVRHATRLLKQFKTFSKQALATYTQMQSYIDAYDQDTLGNDQLELSEAFLKKSTNLKRESETLLEHFVKLEENSSLKLRNELADINRQTARHQQLNLALFCLVVGSALTLIALIVSRSIMRPLKKTFMLEKAVERSMDGVVVFSLDGYIRFMNESWINMHGFHMGTGTSTPTHISAFHPENTYKNDLLPLINAFRKLKAASFEIPHRKQNGDQFPAMMTMNLFEDPDKETSIVAIARDITEKKLSEERLKEKSRQLNDSLKTVESANRRITASLNYAELIQRTIMPSIDRVKIFLPHSFFIWMPKDIVGGDIFFTYWFKNGFVIVLMDCTGHGVPGAFMTMIAYSGIRRIVMDENRYDPADILRQLNSSVKTMLQKDAKNPLSDDGLDAAVCTVDLGKKTLKFAGARMPLFYTSNNDVIVIKGDKQSIGYKDSNPDFEFKNYEVAITDNCFYLTTDGFTDQLGGEKKRRFGTKRLKALLLKNFRKPFEEQRVHIHQALIAHQGEMERKDDVTIIGFRP